MAVTRTTLALVAFALSAGTALPALAGPIDQACSSTAGKPRTCACIQSVADQMLTRDDQRLVASFFKDPDRAQEVRTSDTARDESFWKRYRQFGFAAEQRCS